MKKFITSTVLSLSFIILFQAINPIQSEAADEWVCTNSKFEIKKPRLSVGGFFHVKNLQHKLFLFPCQDFRGLNRYFDCLFDIFRVEDRDCRLCALTCRYHCRETRQNSDHARYHRRFL